MAFLITALIGIVGLAIGGWLYFKTSGFVARSQPATGRYVDARMQSTAGGTEFAKYAVIEFQAGNGQVVRFQGRLGTPFEAGKVGQPVAVIYDPGNPQEALVNTFIEVWMPAVIFLGLGAGWMIAALAILAFSR